MSVVANDGAGIRAVPSDGILRALLADRPGLAMLVIGALPKPAYEHPGELVCVGADQPAHSIASTDFHFLQAKSTVAVAAALRRIGQARSGAAFDLVFIDHDHQLVNILAQLDAARTVTEPGTLFLFDDAVPPTIGMAGPRPTQSWWVGEVWMLPHVLGTEDPDAFTCTLASSPTGLLAAAHVQLPHKAAVAQAYQRLSQTATDADLATLSSHAEPAAFLQRCSQALDARIAHACIALRPGNEDAACLTRRVVEELCPWEKPDPLFVLDLSGRDLDTSALRAKQRWMHGKSIDTFDNVLLVRCDSVVSDSAYYDHVLQGVEGRLEMITTNDYFNFNSGIRKLGGQYMLPKQKLRDTIALDGPVMLGTPDEPDNWGMWQILGIPSLWEFLRNRGDYAGFLAYVARSWQRRLLHTLGLPPEDLIEHDITGAYRCARLSMVRHSHRDLIVSPDDRQIYREVTERLHVPGLVPGHEKIFISRLSQTRVSQSYRGLMNEEELIAALSDLGFIAIEPEQLIFAEQVATFAAARIIVGLGGAGMFNTIFCQPQTKVVTIESGTSFVNAHTNLFASMDCDYGVILGEEDPTDPRTVHRRWSLDVPAAIAQLKRSIL